MNTVFFVQSCFLRYYFNAHVFSMGLGHSPFKNKISMNATPKYIVVIDFGFKSEYGMGNDPLLFSL